MSTIATTPEEGDLDAELVRDTASVRDGVRVCDGVGELEGVSGEVGVADAELDTEDVDVGVASAETDAAADADADSDARAEAVLVAELVLQRLLGSTTLREGVAEFDALADAQLDTDADDVGEPLRSAEEVLVGELLTVRQRVGRGEVLADAAPVPVVLELGEESDDTRELPLRALLALRRLERDAEGLALRLLGREGDAAPVGDALSPVVTLGVARNEGVARADVVGGGVAVTVVHSEDEVEGVCDARGDAVPEGDRDCLDEVLGEESCDGEELEDPEAVAQREGDAVAVGVGVELLDAGGECVEMPEDDAHADAVGVGEAAADPVAESDEIGEAVAAAVAEDCVENDLRGLNDAEGEPVEDAVLLGERDPDGEVELHGDALDAPEEVASAVAVPQAVDAAVAVGGALTVAELELPTLSVAQLEVVDVGDVCVDGLEEGVALRDVDTDDECDTRAEGEPCMGDAVDAALELGVARDDKDTRDEVLEHGDAEEHADADALVVRVVGTLAVGASVGEPVGVGVAQVLGDTVGVALRTTEADEDTAAVAEVAGEKERTAVEEGLRDDSAESVPGPAVTVALCKGVADAELNVVVEGEGDVEGGADTQLDAVSDTGVDGLERALCEAKVDAVAQPPLGLAVAEALAVAPSDCDCGGDAVEYADGEVDGDDAPEELCDGEGEMHGVARAVNERELHADAMALGDVQPLTSGVAVSVPGSGDAEAAVEALNTTELVALADAPSEGDDSNDCDADPVVDTLGVSDCDGIGDALDDALGVDAALREAQLLEVRERPVLREAEGECEAPSDADAQGVGCEDAVGAAVGDAVPLLVAAAGDGDASGDDVPVAHAVGTRVAVLHEDAEALCRGGVGDGDVQGDGDGEAGVEGVGDDVAGSPEAVAPTSDPVARGVPVPPPTSAPELLGSADAEGDAVCDTDTDALGDADAHSVCDTVPHALNEGESDDVGAREALAGAEPVEDSVDEGEAVAHTEDVFDKDAVRVGDTVAGAERVAHADTVGVVLAHRDGDGEVDAVTHERDVRDTVVVSDREGESVDVALGDREAEPLRVGEAVGEGDGVPTPGVPEPERVAVDVGEPEEAEDDVATLEGVAAPDAVGDGDADTELEDDIALEALPGAAVADRTEETLWSADADGDGDAVPALRPTLAPAAPPAVGVAGPDGEGEGDGDPDALALTVSVEEALSVARAEALPGTAEADTVPTPPEGLKSSDEVAVAQPVADAPVAHAEGDPAAKLDDAHRDGDGVTLGERLEEGVREPVRDPLGEALGVRMLAVAQGDGGGSADTLVEGVGIAEAELDAVNVTHGVTEMAV